MDTSTPTIVTQSPLDNPASVFPGPLSSVGVYPNNLVVKTGVWESVTLKQVVDKLVVEDPRFVGLAKFMVNVRFFWSTMISTACAGHGFIFFNPNFYESIPEESRKSVIAHEVWHLILKHLERGEGYDPTIHNIAADHVINIALEDDGFTFEGANPTLDRKYKGQSTEQIYDQIWAKRHKDTPVPGPNHVSKDTIIQQILDALAQDGEGVSLEEQKENADTDVELFGKQPGTLTGQNLIKLDATKTKVLIVGSTYKKIFEEYLIDPLSGGNRTFMRPNRRSHHMQGQKLILPGRYPKRGHLNRLTHLVYALDVSGSITKQQAQQFHDSVRTIKELLNPEKLTVLFFDTRIVLEKTFTDKMKYANIQVKAGGGTSLTAVYHRVGILDPEALVIFTDLQVAIPPQPKWDTIWFVPTKNVNIPANIYGDVYLIPSQER